MDTRVGILGLGTYLPPLVRKNDWWPEAIIEQWRARPADLPPLGPDATPGMRRALAAMKQQGDDPFQGVVERRVMEDAMTPSDMEVAAAERALVHAGIDRSDIDAVLVHTAVPEYLLGNPACLLQHRLGLPRATLALAADASGYSFMAQLALAEALIISGRIRHALLVQSCAASRLLDPTDPVSGVFGDGAAAAVVGPVAKGGVLALVHRSEGALSRTVIANARRGHWYDAERVVLHRGDPVVGFRVFLGAADQGKEVVDAALAAARLDHDAVDFFAAHQGALWLRRVAQETIGLSRARTLDVFERTGYVFAVSLPLILEQAHREGALREGDLVALLGGGVGTTFGAAVLRWGALTP